jgi:homoserine dehydrogenase
MRAGKDEGSLSLASSLHVVPHQPPFRIGILGFGTVGSAVARRLTGPDAVRGLALTHICDRRAGEKQRHFHADPAVVWTTSFADLLRSDVQVIVETVGGVDPAADWIRDALLAGKSVVTANKQVIARAGQPLLALAARQGRQLRFEAAVGGAMPIVRAVGEGLAGDRLERIVAILNGTTNAVLSRMDATGCSFDAALSDARDQGLAEADPSTDVDGGDAAAKLTILCAQAFGVRIDLAQVETRSAAWVTAADIQNARTCGATVRQIAHAAYDVDGTLTAWVAPVAVPRESIFGRTAGAQNAAVITGVHAGEIVVTGRGAGGEATAVAVIGDLLAIARDPAAVVPPPVLSPPRRVVGFSDAEHAQESDFQLEAV